MPLPRQEKGRHPRWRRVVFYALAGAACTYLTTAFVVWLLPLPTMSYSCTGRLQRYRPGRAPYLWVRIWKSPYGSYLQARVLPSRVRTLAMFFDLDAAPADLVRAVQRDPTLPDEHIANRLERYALVRMCTPDYLPRWTTLHNGWPASLKPIDPLLRDRWACYELRMGWPLPGLRGAYRSKNREAQPQAEWNTLLLRRAVAWSGRWSKFRSIVGMPLTPRLASLPG